MVLLLYESFLAVTWLTIYRQLTVLLSELGAVLLLYESIDYIEGSLLFESFLAVTWLTVYRQLTMTRKAEISLVRE